MIRIRRKGDLIYKPFKDGRIAGNVRQEDIKRRELDSRKALDTLYVSLSPIADIKFELNEAKKRLRLFKKKMLLGKGCRRLEQCRSAGQPPYLAQ